MMPAAERRRLSGDPPTDFVTDFTIGRNILFRLSGGWRVGTIIGEGTELRVPVQRLGARAVYWRNRTRLFEQRAKR